MFTYALAKKTDQPAPIKTLIRHRLMITVYGRSPANPSTWEPGNVLKPAACLKRFKTHRT